jgi:hypothetical protein
LAIRRLLQSTGTEISREKFPSQISTECEAATPPRLRARGSSWEERKAISKVKVKDMGKVKVKAKVVWNVRTPPPHLPSFFPELDERFLLKVEYLPRDTLSEGRGWLS